MLTKRIILGDSNLLIISNLCMDLSFIHNEENLFCSIVKTAILLKYILRSVQCHLGLLDDLSLNFLVKKNFNLSLIRLRTV